VLLLAPITPLADLSRESLDLFSIHFIITLHSSIAATSASQYKKKLTFNKMLSILVHNAAANEQLTVNITSNFPQYCQNYWDW